MAIPTRYRHTGLVLVRATTDPGDLNPPGLDPDDPAALKDRGRAWLAALWARAEVREALCGASPLLGARLSQIVTDTPVEAAVLRRAVLSVASYMLRWQGRATPFGLFAGITTATVGPAAAKLGTQHRGVARPDAEWLAAVIDWLEAHPELRPRLRVVADNTAVVRDDRVLVALRAGSGARAPGPFRQVSVSHREPVRYALRAAASPIRFEQLTARLAAKYPTNEPTRLHDLLNVLLDRGFLISGLRPPMTVVDTLTHLTRALRAAGGQDLPEIAAVLDQLEGISELLARGNTAGAPEQATAHRTVAADRMTALAPGIGPVLATDVRLDAQISLPEPVLAEAALAASVLLRVSTRPFGSPAWADYYARFRERYGPGTLVPVRELLAESGLGYPDGYLDAARPERPTWRTLTERDSALLALIQHAALAGDVEINLTETDVSALTVGNHDDITAPQRVELGVTLHAASCEAIDRGQFQLSVCAAPRSYTGMAGRFLPLLTDTERAQLTASYLNGQPPAQPPPLLVQLSYPPRRPHNENIARVPQLLPELVSLSEHPTGRRVNPDDLAVTADADQMYLVQRSTGRPVTPYIPHAVDTAIQSPPLARFLAEVNDARGANFGSFDFGAARTLPHTPRIRYRRTVLAPARWILTTNDLPRTLTTHHWDIALDTWRQRWHLPARVVVCHGELRLPLDLNQHLERALLRRHLDRVGRIELHEDHDGPHSQGWIGRPTELLIPLILTTPRPRQLPLTTPPGATLRPGDSPLIHAQLLGNPHQFDQVLRRLPTLIHQLDDLIEGWWIRRHRDLIRPEIDPHLALFLRLTDPTQFGTAAARLSGFAAHLESLGLPAQLSLTPYHQHPARYGHGPAMAAAESVFAADTTAALAQLTASDPTRLPAQALAAASMTQLAAGFAPDPAIGYRALLGCLKQQTGPLDRTLRDQALALADPANPSLHSTPGSAAVTTAVTAAWQARDTALATYYHALAPQRDPLTVLRTLLHEHHMRSVGVDPATEKVTSRLARAIALRRLALAGAL